MWPRRRPPESTGLQALWLLSSFPYYESLKLHEPDLMPQASLPTKLAAKSPQASAWRYDHIVWIGHLDSYPQAASKQIARATWIPSSAHFFAAPDNEALILSAFLRGRNAANTSLHSSLSDHNFHLTDVSAPKCLEGQIAE